MPVPSTPPGAIRAPAKPRFLYTLSGSRRRPGRADEPYPQGAELRVDIERVTERGGVKEFTTRTTIAADDTRWTTRTLFGDDRIALAGLLVRTNGVDRGCSVTPNADLLRVPVTPGAYPAQRFSSSGCSGTVTVAVEGRERVTDALERGWDAWRIRTRYELQAGTLRAEVTVVSWLSPDLGADVRTTRTGSGTIDGAPFTMASTALLRDP